MGQLGDTLRERRIELGLTVDQVEAAIKVRAQLIRALEEGDYARLPNPGYVRGYISSYGRLLELDTVPLLEMYRLESGSRRYSHLDLGNLPQVDEAVPRTGQQHAVPVRSAVTVALVVAVASLIAWGAIRYARGPEPPLPEPQPATISTKTAEPATSPAVAEPESDTEKPAALQPFTLKITVASDGASWIEATIDGKKAYAGTLTGGQSATYEVAKSATIVVGRPSSVTITRDGKKVTIPTSSSTPTVRLSAEPVE